MSTCMIICIEAVPGEYVRPGETYLATISEDCVYFRNVRTGGGTFMTRHMFGRALQRAWLHSQDYKAETR